MDRIEDNLLRVQMEIENADLHRPKAENLRLSIQQPRTKISDRNAKKLADKSNN